MAIQIYYDSCVILTAKGNAMIAGFLSWNMKLMAIQIYYDSCVIPTAKGNIVDLDSYQLHVPTKKASNHDIPLSCRYNTTVIVDLDSHQLHVPTKETCNRSIPLSCMIAGFLSWT
jgi:hypothetical protein